jgi:hypothetical protein
MFRQLSPEEKSKLGSSVDGPQLIKMLFDEFLFPYSRSFLEMNAMDLLEQRGETSTGGSPYNLQSIQRSATYAGINQPGSSNMMPRYKIDLYINVQPYMGKGGEPGSKYELNSYF